MGMQIWMSWTIVIYILLSVWVVCLNKKEGIFFGKKNVFVVEILFYFFQKICQIFNAKTWKKKPSS
jgi:hypothetical protein